jgi:hypothetical protein
VVESKRPTTSIKTSRADFAALSLLEFFEIY